MATGETAAGLNNKLTENFIIQTLILKRQVGGQWTAQPYQGKNDVSSLAGRARQSLARPLVVPRTVGY